MPAKAKPSRRPHKSVQLLKRPSKVRQPIGVEAAKKKATELNELAKKILDAHEAVLSASFNAFEHAITAGTRLLEMKEQVGHGCWREWLEEHVPEISARTARNYMRLAENQEALQVVREEDRQRAADLSIRGALKMLSKPREEEEDEQTQNEIETEEGGSTNGATNHDNEVEDAREEFTRCAKRLAQTIPQEEFRELVNKICAEVYDKEKFQPHVTGIIAINENGAQRDRK